MPTPVPQTRKAELEYLAQIFVDDGPNIIGIHGAAGTGKSYLLRMLSKKYQQQTYYVNCQSIEPTPEAFNFAFNKTINDKSLSLDQTVNDVEHNLVLLLDQFESFHSLECWLRCDFIPQMENRIKFILSSRISLDNEWIINPPENCTYKSLKLSVLPFTEAVDYLQHAGHAKKTAIEINKAANGHPLALRLMSTTVLEQPNHELSDISLEHTLQTLSDYFIADIKNLQLKQAIEAAACVRRVSEPLLASMLQLNDASDIYHTLSCQEYVEHVKDGLSLNDPLKHALSTTLKTKSPQKFSEYRNKASQVLQHEIQTALPSDLCRYTADIIYLVDNCVIRDAFFPRCENREYTVEPAKTENCAAIRQIIECHEPPDTHHIYEHWWNHASHAFYCVKDHAATVVGFYCLIDPTLVSESAITADPITNAWWLHCLTTNAKNTKTKTHKPKALFIRRWLSLYHGELPCAVQAACWLAINCAYFSMRGTLDHVYLAIENLEPYEPVINSLGFTLLDMDIKFNQRAFSTALLDFSEVSVDSWMSQKLTNQTAEVTKQLSLPSWFDGPAHQLIISNKRIDLTPLEYNTLLLLITHQGIAISRTELLEKVWNIHYDSASNVVDTVVLALRRKLADKADFIQSVRGIGYRFQLPG